MLVLHGQTNSVKKRIFEQSSAIAIQKISQLSVDFYLSCEHIQF